MIREHVEVAIIGGGPGGLTLAQGLKKNGISVAVFEKDRARTDYVQGFRLRIRQRGIDSLIANLPPELYEAFVATLGQAPDRNILLDENFETLGKDAWGGNALGETDDTHIEKSVSRITLRQVLLSGLDGIVRYGKVFSRYGEQPDGSVVAHFEDGSTIHADVLVGADGARSRVRQQLMPHARSFDTGVRRLAGKMTLHAAALHQISPPLLDYNAGVRPTEGHGLMVTSHRVNVEAFRKHGLIGLDDDTHKDISGFHFNNTTSYVWWNTAYEKDELATDDALAKLSGSELLDLLISKIGHWHPELFNLIRYTDPSTVALLHVHSSEPVEPWPTKRVTLLGDAIHAMTYFRALGGNTAIYDAGLLVPELVATKRGDKPLLQALSDYESKMLGARRQCGAVFADSDAEKCPVGSPPSKGSRRIAAPGIVCQFLLPLCRFHEAGRPEVMQEDGDLETAALQPVRRRRRADAEQIVDENDTGAAHGDGAVGDAQQLPALRRDRTRNMRLGEFLRRAHVEQIGRPLVVLRPGCRGRRIDARKAVAFGKLCDALLREALRVVARRTIGGSPAGFERKAGLAPCLGAVMQVGDPVGHAGIDQRLRADDGARQAGTGDDHLCLRRRHEVGEAQHQLGAGHADGARHVVLVEFSNRSAVEHDHVSTLALERFEFCSGDDRRALFVADRQRKIDTRRIEGRQAFHAAFRPFRNSTRQRKQLGTAALGQSLSELLGNAAAVIREHGAHCLARDEAVDLRFDRSRRQIGGKQRRCVSDSRAVSDVQHRKFLAIGQPLAKNLLVDRPVAHDAFLSWCSAAPRTGRARPRFSRNVLPS